MSDDKKERRGWKRGDGAVRKNHGSWYVRYAVGGRRVEERIDAKTEREARKALRKLLNGVEEGTHTPEAAKMRVRELFEDMKLDYSINGRRVADLAKRWDNHLEPVFGGDLATTITTSRILKYIENRYAEAAKPATVKLEIACLRRMFRLGMEATPRKVTFVPKFPKITPNNVRKGFFEHDAFEKVLAELRDPALRTIAIVGYWLGWRKGELLGLERRQVDLDAGTVRLDPGTTKNKEGRVVYLPPGALAAIRASDEHTRVFERERNVIVRNVFHRKGEPIRDFYEAWRSACKRAGVPGMLFHDLRRTAARNYIRSGNHESVVMKILGHKTRSIFDRYNVTSEDDLRQAASRVVSAPRNGSIMGAVVDLGTARR